MGTQIKDLDYYKANKVLFNKTYNLITKQLISRPKIGSCSKLYHILKPSSYQDFLDKYLKSGEDSEFNYNTLTGRYDKGRTLDQINAIATLYHKQINNPDITLEMCFDDLINHIIIETFDGHKIETYLINKLIESGFNVNNEEDDMDAICGVDITVYNPYTNKTISFIQVKPISTFLSNNNKSLIQDRANFFSKQEKLNNYLINSNRQDEIKDIEYVIYKTNEGLLVINGKYRHKLRDICNQDGTTKLFYPLTFNFPF